MTAREWRLCCIGALSTWVVVVAWWVALYGGRWAR